MSDLTFLISNPGSHEKESLYLPEGIKPGYVFLEAGLQDEWFPHHTTVDRFDIKPACTTIIANRYHLRLIGHIQNEGNTVFRNPQPGSVQELDLGRYFAYRFTTIIVPDGRIFHDTSLMEGNGENRLRLTHLLREIASEVRSSNPQVSENLSKIKQQIEEAFGIEAI